MRRLLAAAATGAVSGLALLAAAPPAARAAPEDPASRTRVVGLENGITVLLLEDRSTPVVSLQIWVRVGSRDEARFSGLAHLFEHMMFRGTDRLPPEAHGRLIQARGGRINAYTTRDATVYFSDVSRESLPLAIELEAERFANLRIEDETLASEREVVLEERRLRTETSPGGLAFEALLALAFQAHPYRRPVIGWRSDVEAANVEVCREFFRTYYAPNNLVVVLVGDFDPEDALRRIERSFGDLEPAAEIPRNPTREPEQRGERRSLVYVEARSPILAAAWPAPASGHADAEALDVASHILSVGRSSRLYRRLVYQEAQALSAEGFYWEMQDAGVFYASAQVRPDASIDRVETLLFGELERLREQPVRPDELEKAKRQLEVGLIEGLDTTSSLASRIGSEYVLFGRVRSLEERLAAIRRVSVEDVQRVARTYLQDEKRSVVRAVSPPGSAKGPP
jgi:zinc protease